MLEVRGDLWDFHKAGHWVVITVNEVRTNKGRAVMGRGVALQAAQRWPELPVLLGNTIAQNGNHVAHANTYRLIFFPVKHDWRELADLELIKRSAEELVRLADNFPVTFDGGIRICLPRPGCANGGRTWEEVGPILENVLHGDERFMIVDWRSYTV
jgi:hypothetical protein